MNAINSLADHWIETLWAVSWQVALIAAFIGIVSLLARKASSRFRYCLWCIILVRLCLPVNLTLPFGAGEYVRSSFGHLAGLFTEKRAPVDEEAIIATPPTIDSEIAPAVSLSEQTAGATTAAIDSPLPSMELETANEAAASSNGTVFLIWIGMMAVLGVTIVVRTFVISRGLRKCPPVERSDLIELLEKKCKELGIKRAVQLRYMDGHNSDSPAAIGVFRPKILLPRHTVDEWSLSDLEPVLLHELAHIKRFDLLVNWLQMIVQVVYFFHPVVWLVNAKIRRLREEVCDDVAIEHIGAKRKRYTQSILRVMEETRRETPFAFAGIGFTERKSSLGKRIVRIMSEKYKLHPRMTLSSIAVLILVGIGSIILASDTPLKNALPSDTLIEQKEKESDVKEYKATLPNGISVELIGVCENPSEEKQWWRPDGSLLSVSPYKTMGGTVKTDEKSKGFEFAVRVKNATDFSYRWVAQGAGALTSTGMPIALDGKSINDLRAMAANFPKGQASSTISFGITTEKWRTIVTKLVEGDIDSSHGFEEGGVVFTNPYEDNGTTVLNLSHTFLEPAVQLISVQKDKSVKRPFSTSGGGVTGMVSRTYKFDIPLNEIKEFQFQTRPFQWVVFKNVSLISNIKTDVQVEIAHEKQTANKLIGMVEPTSDNPLGLSDEVLVTFFNLGKAFHSIHIAVVSYHIDHNEFPNDPQDLISPVQYITKIPEDPFSGEPMRIELLPKDAPEKMVMYSVGPDGDWDEGKSIDPTDPYLNGDITAMIDDPRGKMDILEDDILVKYIEGKRTFVNITSRYVAQGPTPSSSEGKKIFLFEHDGSVELELNRTYIQSKGEEIIRKMAEVNRYWLIQPPPMVKSYEYDLDYFNQVKTFRILDVSRAGDIRRQGIQYSSAIHALARDPSRISVDKLNVKNDVIELAFSCKDGILCSFGSFLETNCGSRVTSGTLWIDTKKMVPLRLKTKELLEQFDKYVEMDGGHYAPLSINIDYHNNDSSGVQMIFDWTFRLYKPGLWLFDKGRYRSRFSSEKMSKFREGAVIIYVKINDKTAEPYVSTGSGLTDSFSEDAADSSVPIENYSMTPLNNLAWGEEVDGLRAAVELIPDKDYYALGDAVNVHIHVKNVSDHSIQIAGSEQRQDHATFKNEKGKQISVGSVEFAVEGGLWSKIVRTVLKPAQTYSFKSSGFVLGKREAGFISGGLVSNIVTCTPGRYFLTYELRFPDVRRTSATDPTEDTPQPEDWQGTLKTGERKIIVKSPE